jgi:hypothetical protein
MKSAAAHQNLHNYLNKGGRVFASHWANIWISGAVALPPPSTEPSLATLASFENDQSTLTYQNDNPAAPDTVNIDQNFAKAAGLSSWMQTVGGSTQAGKFPVKYSRVTLDSRDMNRTHSWVNIDTPKFSPPLAKPASQYFSFNTPLAVPDAQQCGQMVFTDIHVSGAITSCTFNGNVLQSCPPGLDVSDTSRPFPTGCQSTGLSPQEKALIYMLFDLTNCLTPGIG